VELPQSLAPLLQLLTVTVRARRLTKLRKFEYHGIYDKFSTNKDFCEI
jgi:hypothetical protein